MSQNALHFLSRLLDRMVPARILDGADTLVRSRARLLVVVVLGTAISSVASAALHGLTDNATRGLFSLLCGPLVLSSLWLLHRPGGRVDRSLFALLSILLVAIPVGWSLSSTGFDIPVPLVVIPLLAGTIGGLVAGGAWTAVTLSVLGVMAVFNAADPVERLIAWSTFVVTGAVGIGTCVAEAARERAMKSAEASGLEASGLARSRDEKEAELRVSREFLALAFRRMPAMLVLTELASGRIIDVNACFERVAGWTGAEARGRTLAELQAWVSPDDRQRIFGQMSGGAIRDFEIQLRTKSGSEIWLLVTADFIDMNGRRLVLAQGLDISDRKRAEQALAASRKLLEDRVVERSERLRASQLELRRQRQLASIGTLAAGVAHQINNPIASIMAAAEYALLPGPAHGVSRDAIRDDALRSVISEAVRCGQIVKNVLRFARQQPTARWVEDLVPVVHRAATLCRDYVTDHGGELRIATDGARLPALVSPIEIEQVVVNLIRNAAEALDDGGTVSVGIYRRESSVEIAIDDEGRGMPRELLDRLFEPFYTTRVQQGGTGLGLSFAHGVIVDHGGEIHVESELGKGTWIRIRLPLAPT